MRYEAFRSRADITGPETDETSLMTEEEAFFYVAPGSSTRSKGFVLIGCAAVLLTGGFLCIGLLHTDLQVVGFKLE